jgi:hypothetical protein
MQSNVRVLPPAVAFIRPAGRFVLELVAMCGAMCGGALILGFAFFEGAARIGYPNLVGQAPAASILILTVFYALAMAIYMGVRGHGLRHNLEMSGVTVAAGGMLAVAYLIGVIPASRVHGWSSLLPIMCAPLCLPMFLLMLIQRDMYTGRSSHHAHAH